MSMTILDKLFKFPIIMVDGEFEDSKREQYEKLAIGNAGTYDLIQGEAECPYYDFLCVSDRWEPKEDSVIKAIEGEFDACLVQFQSCGTYIVPWTKEKFKDKYKKFVESLPAEESEFQTIFLDASAIKNINKSNE